MAAVLISNAARGCADKSFGSVFDLARSRTGPTHTELCMACNTLNRASARRCRCCAHKLTAFYAEAPCPFPDSHSPMNAARPSWSASVRRMLLTFFFFHRSAATTQALP
jgi:hypothetical protein